ncbi:hypothetical protein K1T71_008741 [Dendrolimus kikuchii]|uniref:Uncharacterized protein n=1 Tax=Dendrolimus kikuchii TaxID=765133 RepID=A0ACC1CWT9_9NEOP|nr:hypothetical protein K1T71_008741 [Dendrolimus kikuchii]
MNRKRNVNYIKPEDPEFLKALKKQVGYDDRNHKFDKLENLQNDFVEDGDDELPQVVVLKKGDLTAEQAEEERKKIEKLEADTKADLNQRIVFKPKQKSKNDLVNSKRKHENDKGSKSSKISKKKLNILSFVDEDDDDNLI